MFGFDERYAMFDMTPVENQFILEYLPEAKGDYLKVYLYGLMRCYHPEKDMNPDRMAHELGMTQEEVSLAFGYWERRGLVRRVSDTPPRWEYVNVLQKNVSGDEPEDPEYEAFCTSVYDVFDRVRRLHGSELSRCFEWKEEFGLPTEVILMLLNHMAEIKGKNFRIADADKVAVQMDSEGIRTVEAAEEFFMRDEMYYAGTKKILKKLGKHYLPSEAQVAMYRKWVNDWQFLPEAIDAACDETARKDPNMGYLDSILASIREQYDVTSLVTPEQVSASKNRADGLKEILRELGKGEVNRKTLALYDKMRALYPQSVIQIAAGECFHSGKGPEEVLKLLVSWKEKGLENEEQVRDYVRQFHDQTGVIRELRNLWGGDESKISKTDRILVQKWMNELAFSRELILAAAPFAAEKKMPMNYLDKILARYYEKGIRTPEEARIDHAEAGRTSGAKASGGKGVAAQQYIQRDYTPVQENLMDAQQKEIEAFMNMNGGDPDA